MEKPIMESFDPEDVARWSVASEDLVGEPWCVRLSDYNRLLELYRALKPQMTISEVYGEITIK